MQPVLAMPRVNNQLFKMLHICDNTPSSIRCKRIRSIIIINFPYLSYASKHFFN